MFGFISHRRKAANTRVVAAVWAVAGLLGAGPAASQNMTTSRVNERLRLADVYERVLSRGPKVAAARALADAAATRVTGASLLPDPEVQLGFMN